MRNRHPDKDIEAALCYAETKGWKIVKRTGHAWGSLRCPRNDQDCRCGLFCQMSIWSTPKNPMRHAQQLQQKVDGCTYETGEANE